MKHILILIFVMKLCACARVPVQWGDQGDGTYRNFILWTELSNPDVVRVDEDFYMITSTLHLSPSIAIYHSRDLVNWKMIGHVVSDVTQFSPRYGHDRMEGRGFAAWAAALRYHDGRFWMYVIDPTEGLFMSTATKAEGPWTPLYCVSPDLKNHDDCCPFWDDDGQAYLSCADFSEKRPNREYHIKLFRMSPDGKQLLDSGTVIHKGPIAEATKLYKINGTYYLMFTEQTSERFQRMLRSKSLYGPFEAKTVLDVKRDDACKPVTQGSLVQLENGSWMYIGQSNYTTVWGWPTALLPVEWVDGWPLIGTDTNGDGLGEMAWEYQKPIPGGPVCKPQTSDEFNLPELQPQWEFNFQPVPGCWSLTERPGCFRLKAVSTLDRKPWAVRNVMLQRLIGHRGTVITEMETGDMAPGQSAGICGFGARRTRLVVELTGRREYCIKLETENEPTLVAETLPDLKAIRFRIDITDQDAVFSYSTDTLTYKPVGKPWKLTRWAWLGARWGLLTWNNVSDEGSVDFNWFRYTFE